MKESRGGDSWPTRRGETIRKSPQTTKTASRVQQSRGQAREVRSIQTTITHRRMNSFGNLLASPVGRGLSITRCGQSCEQRRWGCAARLRRTPFYVCGLRIWRFVSILSVKDAAVCFCDPALWWRGRNRPKNFSIVRPLTCSSFIQRVPSTSSSTRKWVLSSSPTRSADFHEGFQVAYPIKTATISLTKWQVRPHKPGSEPRRRSRRGPDCDPEFVKRTPRRHRVNASRGEKLAGEEKQKP